MDVSSVNTLIGGNLFFLELCLKVSSYQRHRTAQYKIHSNRTPTAHELADQRSEFMMSPVYVYVHVRTRSPRNSMVIKRMHKQCVPGALSPPPPSRLGTRLVERAVSMCSSTICWYMYVHVCTVICDWDGHAWTLSQLDGWTMFSSRPC